MSTLERTGRPPGKRMAYDPKSFTAAGDIGAEATSSCLPNEATEMEFLGSRVIDDHRVWDLFRDHEGDVRYLTRYYVTSQLGRRIYMTSSEWLFGRRIPEWDEGEKQTGKPRKKK